MAKRKGFGATAEVHKERSKSTLREIKRLSGQVRKYLKTPADCATAARLVVTLAQQQGSYLIDRYEGGKARTSYGGRGGRTLIDKFIRTCVLKPRSAAAERKMRSVWR